MGSYARARARLGADNQRTSASCWRWRDATRADEPVLLLLYFGRLRCASRRFFGLQDCGSSWRRRV